MKNINPDIVKTIQSLSVKAQVRLAADIPQILNYVNEQVQLEAIKEHGNAIEYIKNPSERVQLEAVKENALAIRHIKNPSEQVKLESVRIIHGLFNTLKIQPRKELHKKLWEASK